VTRRYISAQERGVRRIIAVMALTIVALILLATHRQWQVWQPDAAPKMTCAVTDAREPFPPLFLRGL
jgi:hypothetical protein